MKSALFFGTLAVLCGMFATLTSASAQGTAITYQGRLNVSGSPASGSFDLTFSLFNTNDGGISVAGPITNKALAVMNGMFTSTMNFPVGTFNGSNYWLQIAVRTNGSGAFTMLSSRQQLNPVPYAVYSPGAGTATTANNVAVGSVTSNGIASGQVVKGLNGLKDAVTLSPGANVAITASGNTLSISASGAGSGCSGVPAMQVFSSSGTFTVPVGVSRIMVDVWGGGGGGGSGYANYSGGGGGGSGYGRGVFVVTPGATFTVSIGTAGNPSQNGGSSSFGALISASGGSAGGNASAAAGAGVGGVGGTSLGTFHANGAQGSGGASGTTSGTDSQCAGGAGGSAGGSGGGGGGGGRGHHLTANPGGAGAAPGGGGGGGGINSASGGGSGGSGSIIVYW